jgi:hypothetical protein
MIKANVFTAALLLSACASAPVPRCIPPDLAREPESVTLGTAMPRANPNSQEAYARCKAEEADARLEEKLRADEAAARQREAEQLEQELRETPASERPAETQ